MKVVQVNAVYQYSSTGRTTKEMHLSLLERGIKSYVFCTNYEDRSNNIYRIGNTRDYKIHALLSRLFGKQGYFSTSSTRKLLSVIDCIKPDVVILRNLHGNYINIPLLLQYLADNDIATIAVLHDCWFFTGHCCHYTEDGCYKWQEECHHCPILNKYNKSLFFDNSRKIFQDKKTLFSNIKRLAVVGVSEWTTNEAKRSLLGNAFIIKRIYNWIDLNTFKPIPADDLRKELCIEKEQFVVLGVAQGWSEAKGLSIFSSVAKKYPEIKVVLIGKMKEGQHLPLNVMSVGTLSDAHLLAKYYSMADVFINPSIQETFGKVSAEALACGTPVIANDATANPEIVGDCGVVIHNNDLNEIYNAITTIKNNGRDYYYERCIARTKSSFDKDKNLNEYIQLCHDLIECRCENSYLHRNDTARTKV